MKTKFIIVITLLFFLPQIIFAQSKINLSVGGGYLVSPNSADKLQYWGDGYSINLSIEYLLKDNISISLNSSYQNLFYDENLLQLAAPAVLGYEYTVTGEDSRTYDLSLKARLYMSSSFIRPLISMGTGVLAIEQGNVIGSNWMEGNENSKNTFSLSGSNNNYLIGQFSVGTGIEINFNSNFKMLVEGNLVSSFNNGLVYFPITTSIKFGL
jgi:hypothetical protein